MRDLVLGLTRPGDAVLAVIEDVHMGMGPGAAARSSLDLNRGRIEAVLELLRIDGARGCRRVSGNGGTASKRRATRWTRPGAVPAGRVAPGAEEGPPTAPTLCCWRTSGERTMT